MPPFRRYSLPFKEALGTEFEFGKWHYRASNGDLLTLGDQVPGWDYLKRLEIRRDILVDGKRIAESCDLQDDATFLVVVTAYSSAARFRKVVFTSSPLTSAKRTVHIGVVFSNCGELSRDLSLDTELLLDRPGSSRRLFAASLSGSRLFSESTQVYLEGHGPRMPVELADLGANIPGMVAPDAPWHVVVESSDLHAPVMQSLRVFVNSRNTPVANAVRLGDLNVLSLLKADIARRLATVALHDDEFIRDPDIYADGTTGQAARRVLGICFSGISLRLVQTIANEEPARFESAIQSSMAVHSV